GGTFPNVTKLVVPANKQLDKGYGKYLRTDVSPGRIVNGKLVRRPVIFYNICYGVNAFAPTSHHELAYLFLQWAGGARMYTYLTANPGGYQDPHHTYSFDDPLVVESYGKEPMAAFKEIVPRTAPPITIRGAAQYRQAPKRRVPDLGGRSEGVVSRLLIAPGQLLMLFIVAFPAAVAIYIGFTEWTPTSGDNVWGAYHFWHWFDGYWEALRSGTFWSS